MKDAILFFCVGEMFWEFGRFVPHFIWKRLDQYKGRKNIDFIVLTKPENFDMYGNYANILVPFRLNNSLYKPNCFRLDNMTNVEYLSIIDLFKKQFQDRYNILEVVYPNIVGKNYMNKKQYLETQKNYNYSPRGSNKEIINSYLSKKQTVTLSPRYREGFKRNWNYWNELYDLIYSNKQLIEKYNFVICGKPLEYIPDKQNRFLDINNFEKTQNTSLIGLTMECIKKSILTIGSQSAIPNISLLFGVHALEWGHQKHLHTVTYNIRKTKVTFLDDPNYNIQPEKVYNEILKILK
jgi:hypothetical protein